MAIKCRQAHHVGVSKTAMGGGIVMCLLIFGLVMFGALDVVSSARTLKSSVPPQEPSNPIVPYFPFYYIPSPAPSPYY